MRNEAHMNENLRELTSLIIRNEGDFISNSEAFTVNIPVGESGSAELKMSAEDYEEYCWQVYKNRADLV